MFVPSRIGRYEIKGRIGGGGMGTLYLARDTNPTTDRLVALKLLRTSFDSDDLRQRFAREAQALAELNHPNIVIIHDSGEYQDSPFIVMEYIRGETLAESIRRRASMSLGQKLGFLGELCAGLAHAHEAGIIHRDIKPANLMVDLHGRLKILDFGIARVDTGITGVAALTRLNVSIGTPGYMSPEQIEGGEIDVRTDLFAVGAVAYELISYREAFPGATTRQIENKVLHEQPLPLASSIPSLDPEIGEIIASALEKDVHRRCEHAATLGRAFERVRARLEEDERLPRTTPSPKVGGERRPRHERAAQLAYERALASHSEGADGFARRSAMEALAEFPQHADARHLLSALGHLRDVEPWLPPSAQVAAAAAQVGEPSRTPQPPLAQATMTSSPPSATGSTVAQPTELWHGPLELPASAPPPESPSEALVEPPSPAPEVVPPPHFATPPPQPAPQPGAQTKNPAAGAARPKAAGWPRGEARFGVRRMARGAFRLAIVIVALLIAGVVGAILARRLWPAIGATELLTIEKPAGGTILGDGVECGTRGSKCAVTLARGTAVALRAEADAGFVLTAFTGECDANGGTVMDGARSCGAAFSPVSAGPAAGETGHLLTIDMPSGGTIEGTGIRCGALGTDCSAKQPANAPVRLTATANAGFAFGAFTGDCGPDGTTTMTAPRRCGATFIPAAPPPAQEWVLTVTKPTGGTIVGTGINCGAARSECTARHPHGFAVALRQQAEKGYRFVAFTGDCTAAGKTVMTAARMCGATFAKEAAAPPAGSSPTLTITPPRDGMILAANISCGTAGAQCSAPQTMGATVMLRAQPDAGFRFVAFTGDCDAGGSVVMTSPRTCSATFVKAGASASTAVSFHLAVTRSRDGTISGNGINCGPAGSVCIVAQPRGTVVQLRVQPNPGFRLAAFTGDCDSNGATVMTSARTCGATFVKDSGLVRSYELTVRRPRNGTIYAEGLNCGTVGTQCVAILPGGSSAQLRAEPNAGFTFAGFTGDCSSAGVVMMTAARTCGVTFTAAAGGPPSTATGPRAEVIAGQPAIITAPKSWQQLRWQVSSDGGRSWEDLSNGDDYAGVTTTTLTIKRTRVELNGRQYRARLTEGAAATSSAVTLIVKAPSSPPPRH